MIRCEREISLMVSNGPRKIVMKLRQQILNWLDCREDRDRQGWIPTPLLSRDLIAFPYEVSVDSLLNFLFESRFFEC